VTRASRSAALHILLAASWFGIAARADQDSTAVQGDIPTIPCLERAAAVTYLHRFQDQVMLHWVVPEDTPSDQTVAVRFRLSEDGNAVDWKLEFSSNHRIANSVELAFRHAISAGPIPESAACLIDRMVEMRFENPY